MAKQCQKSTFKVDYTAWEMLKPDAATQDAQCGRSCFTSMKFRENVDADAAGISIIPDTEAISTYLRASHFNISQDPHVTKPCQKSRTKLDYPAWKVQKTVAATPCKPSEVLMRDYQCFNDRWSETQREYPPKRITDRDMPIDPDKLRATNFKLDRDMRQNTWQTTHKRHYLPKESDVKKWKPKINPSKSCIPQGDKEKADEPVSEFRDRYRGHVATIDRPVIAPGELTLKGDNRQSHFVSTHDDLFKGYKLQKNEPFLPPTGTNVPQGDPIKVADMMTTHQHSYPRHNVMGREYDREAALKLRETTFKDKESRLHNYNTEMGDEFTPKKSTVERPGSRPEDNILKGDGDLRRMTTNLFYQGKKPATVRPARVDASDLRTKSDVTFAELSGNSQYYDTEHKVAYQTIKAPKRNKKVFCRSASSIPFDFYKDCKNNSLYREDYHDPKQGKLVVTEAGLDRLKQSHIGAPLGNLSIFSTEHKDRYVPKTVANKACFETGKLQKSSLPFGTMNENNQTYFSANICNKNGKTGIYSTEHKDSFVAKMLDRSARYESGKIHQESVLPFGTLNQIHQSHYLKRVAVARK